MSAYGAAEGGADPLHQVRGDGGRARQRPRQRDRARVSSTHQPPPPASPAPTPDWGRKIAAAVPMGRFGEAAGDRRRRAVPRQRRLDLCHRGLPQRRWRQVGRARSCQRPGTRQSPAPAGHSSTPTSPRFRPQTTSRGTQHVTFRQGSIGHGCRSGYRQGLRAARWPRPAPGSRCSTSSRRPRQSTVALLPNPSQHLAIAGNVADSGAVKAAFAQRGGGVRPPRRAGQQRAARARARMTAAPKMYELMAQRNAELARGEKPHDACRAGGLHGRRRLARGDGRQP
jgi:hypothetical protein